MEAFGDELLAAGIELIAFTASHSPSVSIVTASPQWSQR
jgi:hypothetical protein